MIKRKSKENKWFYFFNTLILVLFSLLIIVPIWNILVSSVSSSSGLAGKGLVLWPKGFTLENYRKVFSDSSIPRAFLISVLKTVIGASTHTLFCAIVAYGLSKSRLVGRNIYTTMGVITMYFGGGMIPTYLLIKSLGLLDTFWVYIIPALFSYYDVVILMNFFREIPPSLEESAKIDGASEFQIFYKIFLPLTKPALATIILFNGVGQWNDFMTTKLYITKEYLYPLQMKIYEIIVQSNLSTMTESGSTDMVVQATTRGVQLATIVITTIPILIIYPLLQKHFIGGMTGRCSKRIKKVGNNMKKVLGGLLVATAVVSLAACSGGEKKASSDVSIKDRYELDEKTPAWKLDKKKEPTKIKWYINSDWTALPFGKDVTTAQIKKDLNVDIEFISGDDSKLNAMISSGDMPDIVTLTEKTGQAALKADSWPIL